jgi:hypothetical protein
MNFRTIPDVEQPFCITVELSMIAEWIELHDL